jgi:hypothetical protein
MDIREIGWGGMEWINLAQDRDQWRALVNTVMNLGKFLSGSATNGFSRRAQFRRVSYLYEFTMSSATHVHPFFLHSISALPVGYAVDPVSVTLLSTWLGHVSVFLFFSNSLDSAKCPNDRNCLLRCDTMLLGRHLPAFLAISIFREGEYSSALKMETAYSSVKSVNFYQTIRRHSHLHSHNCKKFKSHKLSQYSHCC